MLTLLAEFPHAVQLVDLICMRRVSLVPRLRFSVLQATESWAGAGNEASAGSVLPATLSYAVNFAECIFFNFAPSSSKFMSFAIRQLLHAQCVFFCLHR